MKHEYLDNQTNAFFSVASFNELKDDLLCPNAHKWFTIFVINRSAGAVNVDDVDVEINSPTILFVTPGQYITFDANNDIQGFAISFNQEFYCIEYHDSDVSCQGLLFVNNFKVVRITMDDQQHLVYNNTVKEMAQEFEQEDVLQVEMLKNLLKNLLIRSNRLFRNQNSLSGAEDEQFDFARRFSTLVEKNFLIKKSVDEYAEMMNVAPATLTKKLQKCGVETPSQIIRNRVVTEAKRFLLYTDKSVKEIAYHIGYEDQYYFSRLFSKETQLSPSEYRKANLKAVG